MRKGNVQVNSTLEHFVEAFFQSREGGGPCEYIVHYLFASWEALNDAVRVSAPFVGGRGQAHRGTEVAVTSRRQDEGSEVGSLVLQRQLKIAVSSVQLREVGGHRRD